MKFFHFRFTHNAYADIYKSYRLFFRSACRACYACYADSNVRTCVFSESLCHFKSGFITHCTVFFQRFALDTEIFHLRRICISHKAFIQDLRRTRNICYKCRKKSSCTAFSRRNSHFSFRKHFYNFFV